MVIDDYFPEFSIEKYNFLNAPFWIQIQNIPRNLIYKENIHKVAESIEPVIEMERMPSNELVN